MEPYQKMATFFKREEIDFAKVNEMVKAVQDYTWPSIRGTTNLRTGRHIMPDGNEVKFQLPELKICPCGIQFIPLRAGQIYHDGKCRKKYQMRRYRERLDND